MSTAVKTPASIVSPGAWGTLFALALARVTFGFQLQTVASIGPDLAATYDLDFAALGTLYGAYMAPGVAVALPSGFLGRRFGDRGMMLGGLLLMVAGGILAGLGGLTAISAGRAIAGAGAVAMSVLYGKIVADRFSGPAFSVAMAIMVGAFPMGIGLAQISQTRLSHALGWEAAFQLGAAMAAVCTLLFVLTWRPLADQGPRSLVWPSRRELMLVFVAGLIWTFFNAAYLNFLAYMPSYLAVHGHAAWVGDVVIMIATWANLPAMLLGAAIAVRFGVARVMISGSLLCALAVGGLAVFDLPLLWGLVFGTVGTMHGGLIVQIGTLSCRPENRAVGMGVFFTTYYIGGTWMPAVCGAAADWAGDPAGAFVAAAALSLLAVPCFLVHRRMTRAA